jgi:hypothetical protein
MPKQSAWRWLRGAPIVVCLAALALGCSRIADIGWLQTDQQMLDSIARRALALTNVEGSGTVRVEYHGSTLDLPFRLRLGPQAAIQVDAEIPGSVVPGRGRVTLVSDGRGTQIYGVAGLDDLVEGTVRQATFRALVLSLLGGGDLLAAWVRANGCRVDRLAACSGLDLELWLNREERSIDRWEVEDKTGKSGFSGLVHARESAGPLPRVVTAVVHPQEIAVTVRFDDVGLVRGEPDGGPPAGDAKAGNFAGEKALQ